jgi:hypothetical protein
MAGDDFVGFGGGAGVLYSRTAVGTIADHIGQERHNIHRSAWRIHGVCQVYPGFVASLHLIANNKLVLISFQPFHAPMHTACAAGHARLGHTCIYYFTPYVVAKGISNISTQTHARRMSDSVHK